MPRVDARIAEIQLDQSGHTCAWIHCPRSAVPTPGQYCMAEIPGDPQAVLQVALMTSEVREDGFLAVPMASKLPPRWVPGTSLSLRGPMGRGFTLPENPGRLALAACEDSIARLRSLAIQAAAGGADISWFTDAPAPSLPAAHELNPLRLLPEALSWADWIALEVNLLDLLLLQRLFDLPPAQQLPVPGQVLILTPMPCAGKAECGVCSVPARRGWKLACMDGPVFDLHELDW